MSASFHHGHLFWLHILLPGNGDASSRTSPVLGMPPYHTTKEFGHPAKEDMQTHAYAHCDHAEETAHPTSRGQHSACSLNKKSPGHLSRGNPYAQLIHLARRRRISKFSRRFSIVASMKTSCLPQVLRPRASCIQSERERHPPRDSASGGSGTATAHRRRLASRRRFSSSSSSISCARAAVSDRSDCSTGLGAPAAIALSALHRQLCISACGVWGKY